MPRSKRKVLQAKREVFAASLAAVQAKLEAQPCESLEDIGRLAGDAFRARGVRTALLVERTDLAERLTAAVESVATQVAGVMDMMREVGLRYDQIGKALSALPTLDDERGQFSRVGQVAAAHAARTELAAEAERLRSMLEELDSRLAKLD